MLDGQQLFNLLPIDVVKLIADIYYTPIISSLEEDKKFYLILSYPSHTIKLQMSLPEFRYGKGLRKIYSTEEIELFIKSWDHNIIHMKEPFDLKITLDDDYISIIHEEVNMEIKINNTEQSVSQLLNAMWQFVEFVQYYDPEW